MSSFLAKDLRLQNQVSVIVYSLSTGNNGLKFMLDYVAFLIFLMLLFVVFIPFWYVIWFLVVLGKEYMKILCNSLFIFHFVLPILPWERRIKIIFCLMPGSTHILVTSILVFRHVGCVIFCFPFHDELTLIIFFSTSEIRFFFSCYTYLKCPCI